MKNYIKLIRPHHYIKNMLVFSALTCSGKLFEPDKLYAGFLGFLSFCMVSSAVYIVNDIRDVENDKRHPSKCMRPIASGKVSTKNAWLLAGTLLILSFACNRSVFRGSSTMLLALYFILNLAYSFGLKNIALLDVSILVSGFLLRVLYGAIVTEIKISNWMYLTITSLAFYFSLGKRRNERKQNYFKETRRVLNAYPDDFLDKSMNMCLTLAITFYALWSMDKNTVEAYGQNMLLTVIIVLLIVMKYSLNIEGQSDGDPVEVLFRDKVLLLLCAVYAALMLIILYF